MTFLEIELIVCLIIMLGVIATLIGKVASARKDVLSKVELTPESLKATENYRINIINELYSHIIFWLKMDPHQVQVKTALENGDTIYTMSYDNINIKIVFNWFSKKILISCNYMDILSNEYKTNEKWFKLKSNLLPMKKIFQFIDNFDFEIYGIAEVKADAYSTDLQTVVEQASKSLNDEEAPIMFIEGLVAFYSNLFELPMKKNKRRFLTVLIVKLLTYAEKYYPKAFANACDKILRKPKMKEFNEKYHEPQDVLKEMTKDNNSSN